MSEPFFNNLYSDLYKVCCAHAKRFCRQSFFGVDWQDFVQIGLIGVLEMEDGHEKTMYFNRAKRRMIDYIRYLKARKRYNKLIDISLEMNENLFSIIINK